MKQLLLLVISSFLFSFCFTQSNTTSIGFFYGPSIGYNAIHSGVSNDHGLLDISFETGESFGNSIVMLDDDDLTNNVELFNGRVFGLRANFPIISSLSIQSELEIESISFNHILYQNSEDAVFVDIISQLSGLENEGQYKIANYLWRVNYINFPFLLKIYPVQNAFLQVGAKFGFLLKAQEIRATARFNEDNQTYIDYDFAMSDVVVYEFFDSTSGIDNHGFDKDEWPFTWNAALLAGFGYEKTLPPFGGFYFSARYSLGLLPFFREIENKDDDFFEQYNSEFDDSVYQTFVSEKPIINNNFKLHTISFAIGWQISN
tara:strand:- start:456 stop:1406 length:951 start_codon:yes stop_codon:yes gene_type:complete